MANTADYYYSKGLALLEQGSAPDALWHARAALAVDPDHLDSLILAGQIYTFRGGDLYMGTDAANTEAMQCFERALELAPDLAEAWSGRGFLQLRLGQPQQALESAEKGLSALPSAVGEAMQDPDLRNTVTENLFSLKVRALLALGRTAEARTALSDGLLRCPDSTFLTRHTKWFLPEGAE